MSEQQQETPAEETPAEDQKKQESPPDSTDWKAEAQKWEARSKENFAKSRELEKQQRATMTEAERAVVEAEARGRMAAATEYGKQLARSEFNALAARRNADFDPNPALDIIDLGKFLTEDGDVNSKALTDAVSRLVPEPNGTPSYDGGARKAPLPAVDMNSHIRQAAGRT